ncbi:unnamed protein product [Cercospora beticola]|nr:unnamed protein product [Cercospora beticola]
MAFACLTALIAFLAQVTLVAVRQSLLFTNVPMCQAVGQV